MRGRSHRRDLTLETLVPFAYDELTTRDMANLDTTWLRGEASTTPARCPHPACSPLKIVEEFEAAHAQSPNSRRRFRSGD